MPDELLIKRDSQCAVCGAEMECSFELPNLPLTGIFVDEVEPGLDDCHDQSLLVCGQCGHAQLGYILSPGFLYGDHYAHRSSASHLTPSSTDFIMSYIGSLCNGRKFGSALEIGCNDLVLLNKLAPIAGSVVGVDPLWIGKSPENTAANMTVIGDFVENVDLNQVFESKPDLVVSTHNLEHIISPRDLLVKLLASAADEAVLVMEVPDLDCMIHNMRFDQVFHQHIHYFNLASMLRLLDEAGACYVDHTYNWRNWGGSLTVAFSKDKSKASARPEDLKVWSADEIYKKYIKFRRHMQEYSSMIQDMPGEKWAYGAAQMLPVLAYHLETDFSFLQGIMDDCPKRTGLTYPTIKARIFKPDETTRLDHASVIVTALDAVRPIMNRLRDFNPRFVTTPALVY